MKFGKCFDGNNLFWKYVESWYFVVNIGVLDVLLYGMKWRDFCV